MKNIDGLTIENKIVEIYQLMFECPMGKVLEGCPVKDVRILPLRERLALVNQMEESQLDAIIDYHRQCSRHMR